jgi:CheY-like chemotaxis protein
MHPDLVVTNLLAGGMDFFGLQQGLKAAPETAHIPVMALTARLYGATEQAAAEERVEFVLLQGNELVEKRLLAAITRLFRRTDVSPGSR